MNGEKRYISGTNPEWDFEVPDGMINSMVDKQGRKVDNGWNFDEWDDESGNLEGDIERTGWDELAENS